MKKQSIQDERVLNQKRKIGSDAYSFLFIALLLSILVQQYVFNASFSQYAVEFICLILSSIYVLVRNIMIGNDIFSSKRTAKSTVIINSVVCGLTITVVNGIYRYIEYKDAFTNNLANFLLTCVITFACGTFTAFIAYYLLYKFNNNAQKKIEEKLNADEDSL